MKRRHLCLLICCITSYTHAAQLPADLGARLTQGYIAGATQRFAEAGTSLAQALHTGCTTPDETARAVIHDAFTDTVTTWSAIEFLRFGPLIEANRFERIFFWPDPRGVMLRQIQALLANPQEDAGDAQALARRSVALQGLPALEYLLYRDGGLLAHTTRTSSPRPLAGEGAPQGRERAVIASTCAYAQALGHNLIAQGRELANAWQMDGRYGVLFARPGPNNSVYRSQREVAAEAFKALSTGLQFLREVKLAPWVGDTPDVQRLRRAPFWRSALTTRSLHASVVGLRAFLQAGAYQNSADVTASLVSLDAELARAEQLLAAMPDALTDTLADPEGYRQWQLIILLLGNAKRLIDENVAPAFGVTIGFNALDGD